MSLQSSAEVQAVKFVSAAPVVAAVVTCTPVVPVVATAVVPVVTTAVVPVVTIAVVELPVASVPVTKMQKTCQKKIEGLLAACHLPLTVTFVPQFVSKSKDLAMKRGRKRE